MEALVAREKVRHVIVKAVEGKGTASWFAGWADVCDDLDCANRQHLQNSYRHGHIRDQGVGRCLTIAARKRIDRRTLWRKQNHGAE